MFSLEPGWTHQIQPQIRTPPGVIVRQWSHHMLEACHQAIEAEVAQNLKADIIEQSTSPCSSHIMVVPKPNGKLQLCNDFHNSSMSSMSERLCHSLGHLAGSHLPITLGPQ